MKRVGTMMGATGVLLAGATAAVAFGAGSGGHTAASTSAAGTTTAEQPTPKVWLCHHTGSWKHPYHLIHVSADAAAAHRRHGDVDPGSGNSCPTAQPAAAKHHGAPTDKSRSAQDHGRSAEHGKAQNHAAGKEPRDADEASDSEPE